MENAVFLNVYKLKKGANVEDFRMAAKRLVGEEISKSTGFISSTLMVDGDTWVDTIVFETREDLIAFETAAKRPSDLVKEFYSYINFMAKGNKMLKLAVVSNFNGSVSN